MTGPIKPPGAPGVPAAGPTPGDVGKIDKKAESGAFQETLAADAAGSVESARSSQAASSVSASVAAELRAGSIDATQAVDRLVEEALRSPMAASLNDAGRQALEQHLRESLADDPSLASLVSDLDRS